MTTATDAVAAGAGAGAGAHVARNPGQTEILPGVLAFS